MSPSYPESLRAEILEKYSTTKMFHAYGFGAKLPNGQVGPLTRAGAGAMRSCLRPRSPPAGLDMVLNYQKSCHCKASRQSRMTSHGFDFRCLATKSSPQRDMTQAGSPRHFLSSLVVCRLFSLALPLILSLVNLL